MGLKRLVLFHLDLLEFSIVVDLLDNARIQLLKPLSPYYDDAAEFLVGGHLGKRLVVFVQYLAHRGADHTNCRVFYY